MEKVVYGNLHELSGKGTHNLRLRPIQDSDTNNIVCWRNNEDIRSQFIFREPFTLELHHDWLRNKVYQGHAIQYIIESNERPIGSVYVRDIDLQNESGEFGIFIGEIDEMGKGIGSITARMFTRYCFDLGFHRIFLRVLDNNSIAKKSYINAGFEIEGTARDMVCIDGIRHDVTFMSIINR